MGVGKTFLAKKLAEKLGWELIDTDHLVESKAGCPISEIFARSGEEGFRDLETAVLHSLADLSGKVISTGGGIVLREENRRLLTGLGCVVWLRASEATIFERVSRNRKRPLLQTADPRATLHALLEPRLPLYAGIAEIEIDTGRMRPAQSIALILKSLPELIPVAS